jgi:hypothetical protein
MDSETIWQRQLSAGYLMAASGGQESGRGGPSQETQLKFAVFTEWRRSFRL